MTEPLRLAAVDLGAESGRVMTGHLVGDRIGLQLAHRFANRPLWLPDGLHWNLPDLFSQILHGLAEAAAGGPLAGAGIDAWGCDYALLDGGDRMLGLPFHYRDPARTGEAVVSGVHRRVGRGELYRRTGIQTMPINTVFQLSAEATGSSPALAVAERIALIPDLLGLWLTGTLANELTIASTTGLLQAHGPHWAVDLVGRLGLPRRPFAGAVVQPGSELGPVLDGHAGLAGEAVGMTVRTVAGHDTASAFVAAPLNDRHGAILSSGTWSLLGVELDEPELGPDAAACNLTNERGVDGTTRLLRNVMGLWLVQECRRCWEAEGIARDYDELQELAAGARPDVSLFDPDHDSLLLGGDMPARIQALCAQTDQTPAAGPGELLRSILVSLACKYRMVLEQLAAVSGRRIDTIHVVGGGARNALLCRLTADLCDRPVLAGPVEATALGNVLVQAAALGEVSGLEQMRELVRRSETVVRHEPSAGQPAAETYQRFLAVTGLGPARPQPRPVAIQGEQ
jgi:rhamnulokinase